MLVRSITNTRFSRYQSASEPRSVKMLQPASALAAVLTISFLTSEVGGAIDGSTGDFLNIPDRDHA